MTEQIELEIADLKSGSTLQKGKRKRIFLGMEGFFVYYSTPSSKSVVGERYDIFEKWLNGASVVQQK